MLLFDFYEIAGQTIEEKSENFFKRYQK